jgi:hypothetical protein
MGRLSLLGRFTNDVVDATMDLIIRARLPAQLLRKVQHLRASQKPVSREGSAD